MVFLFYKFLFFLSDFVEIQRKSFYLFLNELLSQEFTKIQPFWPRKGLFIKLGTPLEQVPSVADHKKTSRQGPQSCGFNLLRSGGLRSSPWAFRHPRGGVPDRTDGRTASLQPPASSFHPVGAT